MGGSLSSSVMPSDASNWNSDRRGGSLTRILVINDSPSVQELLRKILMGDAESPSKTLNPSDASPFMSGASEPHGFLVDGARGGEEGCDIVLTARSQGRPYAVAFVDMQMAGDWDLVKTIEELWRVDSTIQVVICADPSYQSPDDMTARLDRSDRSLILRKPFQEIEVRQLACALSDKWWLLQVHQRRLNELEQLVEEQARHLRRVLSERTDYETQLHFQATHDALTRLPNRNLLNDCIAQAIAQARRTAQHLAVLFLDLDRFKFINDSFGHQVGDALLKAVATRLKETMRESDTVARLGGDEFVIMLTGLVLADDAGSVAQKLLGQFSQPFKVEGHEFYVTASMGVSVYPDDGDTSDTLLRNADAAMYRAKDQGRDRLQFYTREMSVEAQDRVMLERALRRALDRQEFELYYQPKVDLRTGQIRGVEALIRWRHPELGLVTPDRFIPLAEETGLIVPIGEWVLRTACAQAKAWHVAGYCNLSVAVNLSARQFRQQSVPDLVRHVLKETGLTPEYLELELTESLLMQDCESIVRALRELKTIGVVLSLDDFGTGYSSLSYLKRFPIEVVKIDRSFIRDLTSSVDDASITKAIIAMAQSLNIRTIAEGVETEGQVAVLSANQCDEIQGFFFSHPVPAKELEAMLREGRRLPDNLLPKQKPKPQRTLLLVDDEDNIVSALKRLLRRDGYRILTANSGQQGLELLAQNEVDVIISDQRMPTMTGVEFLRRAKAMYPNTVRIVLSGYTDLQSVTDAINEGAIYKFLTKPWDDNQLRGQIEEAFCRKEMADENRRLSGEVHCANEELADLNRLLHELLEEKQEQIASDETSLGVAREMLQNIPLPVICWDVNGTIAFINADAENLFQTSKPLLGCAVSDVLPESLRSISGGAKLKYPVEIDGQCFLATSRPIGASSHAQGALLTLMPC